MAVSHLYQPIGVWTGRLILPPRTQRPPDDSVLFEVHNAAPDRQPLIGKIVQLKWSRDPSVQTFVQAVTRDVEFTEETEKSEEAGNIHPDRLNGLTKVGPLASLAGARSKDDVTVLLREPMVVDEGEDRYSLVISQEPVQITGRLCALVTITQRETESSDRFIVRHYNPLSQQFDGPLETLRIPQVPADSSGVARSTNHLIEQSDFNQDGWYIYGETGTDGLFVVQAIEPRRLLRLTPDRVDWEPEAIIAYLTGQNWDHTPLQKGKVWNVSLGKTDEQGGENPCPWQEGDIGIVIHSFGGIGGKKGEPTPFGLVTGHFAYGKARVVRDRFTDELRFDIEYQQVYAHNPDGIVAGSFKWQSYLGDLQRGWLGNRPVCDIIFKLDAVCQDYDFGGIKLSPLAEFNHQLEIMTARYRIGDGTGASLVTPATSCVQDSNQALYTTIQKVATEIESHGQIQEWLQRHPESEQNVRFQQLLALAAALEKELVPLGIARPDWAENARLAGIYYAPKNPSLDQLTNPIKAAISWRTMLPRRAQDEIATILVKEGAIVWIVRTNQVGGFDPDIEPLAPTTILRNLMG